MLQMRFQLACWRGMPEEPHGCWPAAMIIFGFTHDVALKYGWLDTDELTRVGSCIWRANAN